MVFSFFLVYGQNPKATVNFTSSNLPIVLINTNGQSIINESYITATMGVIDYGLGATNRITDPVNDYDGSIKIRTRGSWTLQYPQKSYNVTTVDFQGVDFNYKLMGMKTEHKWALYAPYDDYTFVSNPLAFKLSREMGWWAPRTRFCEVMLDTGLGYNYNGIYIMMEKIKRDKNRVDIARLDADDNAGDSLTGGYIIGVDRNINELNPSGFNTKNSPSVFIEYVYPDGNDITAQQKKYIKDYIDTVENALLASDFSDPVNGYRKYLDELSFIDFFIIQELSKNLDGFKRSAFLYKDKDSKGGKLHAGPQWDFNAAWGNSEFTKGPLGVCGYENPEGWVYSNGFCWMHNIATNSPVPFWWSRLLEDPEYVHQLKCRWMKLRQTTLSKSHINNLIDSIKTLVTEADAQKRQYTRYDFSYTYSEQCDFLKNWISARIDWMDENMPGSCLDIGIEEESVDVTFSLYPNPANEFVIAEINLQNPERITLELLDALGKSKFKMDSKEYSSGIHEVRIPVLGFSSGVYFVKIQSGHSSSIKKVIISP